MIEGRHIGIGRQKEGKEGSGDKEKRTPAAPFAPISIRQGANPGIKPRKKKADAPQEGHFGESRPLVPHDKLAHPSHLFDKRDAEVIPHQPKEKDEELLLIVPQGSNRIDRPGPGRFPRLRRWAHDRRIHKRRNLGKAFNKWISHFKYRRSLGSHACCIPSHLRSAFLSFTRLENKWNSREFYPLAGVDQETGSFPFRTLTLSPINPITTNV